MRLTIIFVMLLMCCFSIAAQEDIHQSPNGCPEENRPHFHWKKMAVRPVGSPLEKFEDLKTFLSPEGELFNRSWQQIAKAEWGWTDGALRTMWLAALQDEGSNFRRVRVEPCTVLNDMIYDQPATVLGLPVVADWEDKQPKDAWVWQIGDTVEAYFFVGCSNPTYRVKVPVERRPQAESMRGEERRQIPTRLRRHRIQLPLLFQELGRRPPHRKSGLLCRRCANMRSSDMSSPRS